MPASVSGRHRRCDPRHRAHRRRVDARADRGSALHRDVSHFAWIRGRAAQSDADGCIVLDFGSWRSVGSTTSSRTPNTRKSTGRRTSTDPRTSAASERRRAHDFGELALEGASVAGESSAVRETPVPPRGLFLRSGFGHDFWPPEPIGESRFDGSFELDERIATRSFSPILYAVTPTGVGWVSPTIVKGRDRIESLEIEIEVPARLDARVVDESGAPISGASVFALPRFPPFGPSSYRPHASDAPSSAPGAWSDVFGATTDRTRLRCRTCPKAATTTKCRDEGRNPRTHRLCALGDRPAKDRSRLRPSRARQVDRRSWWRGDWCR